MPRSDRRTRYDTEESDGAKVCVFRVELRAGGVLVVETPPVPLSKAQKEELAQELHELADTIRTAGDVPH